VITDSGLLVWRPNEKIIFFHRETSFDGAYILPCCDTLLNDAYCCEFCDNPPNVDILFIDKKFCRFICEDCIGIFREYCWALIRSQILLLREIDIIDDIKNYIFGIIIRTLCVIGI
jgi:hypothetical protein